MANDIFKAPTGHKGLTIGDLNKFSLDANHQLYWNRAKIKSESTLSRAQKTWAVSLAVLGAASALATLANVLNTLNKEYCWVSIGETCQLTVGDGAATKTGDSTETDKDTQALTPAQPHPK